MLTAVQHRWAVPAASRARIGRVVWRGHHDASLAEKVVYELLIVPANNLRRSSGGVGIIHTAPEAAMETLPGSVMHNARWLLGSNLACVQLCCKLAGVNPGKLRIGRQPLVKDRQRRTQQARIGFPRPDRSPGLAFHENFEIRLFRPASHVAPAFLWIFQGKVVSQPAHPAAPLPLHRRNTRLRQVNLPVP